jgi:hypothetical protein
MVSDLAASPPRAAGGERSEVAEEFAMSDWREQEVGNETSSREINEWIDESSPGADSGGTYPYVCECSDGACKSTIALTHAEYEEVRAYGTHFAIARDHESPDLDLMVSERARFTIVRKLPGLPARLANASDPRRSNAGPGSG